MTMVMKNKNSLNGEQNGVGYDTGELVVVVVVADDGRRGRRVSTFDFSKSKLLLRSTSK
jgi:ribosomal protein L22